ncbi:MAG: peptide deformylase [Planctomycetota bacterium]
MEPLQIVEWPDERLRQPNRAIAAAEFKAGQAAGVPLQELVSAMTLMLESTGGLGLAAPQVGVPLRLCLVNASLINASFPKTFALFNPVIVKQTGRFISDEEGCLSFPKIYAPVRRKLDIIVDYQDIAGEKKRLEWTDFPARIVLHELDHLEGRLFIDRVAGSDRVAIETDLEIQKMRYKKTHAV